MSGFPPFFADDADGQVICFSFRISHEIDQFTSLEVSSSAKNVINLQHFGSPRQGQVSFGSGRVKLSVDLRQEP